MPEDTNWLIMGNFNYIRYPSNRNREGGGSFNDMLKLNDAINSLGLFEIPLKGKSYTWSNMQGAPLLEKLDWVFSSEAWTVNFPTTMTLPLSKAISNHTPCLIKIGTHIPRAKIFRFENYWFQIDGFKQIVQNIWCQDVQEPNNAKCITAKLKRLRKGLKIWAKGLSPLASTISSANELIQFFDTIKEFTKLSIAEWNGREIVKKHLFKLLD